MPTGTLPASGKKLWEEVYDKALKGSCKGDKTCAAGSAWKAVKNAGWRKGKDGKWHKSLPEFTLAITRASYDKATNRMNWRAVASDTDTDSFNDSMTLSLFEDFVQRIEKAETPSERYTSDFWQGGVPYLSLSHYPDLDGMAVPGVVEKVYIDGNRLKATGYFDDSPLGRACFKSVCNDLYGTSAHPEGKVRISIAFLDYAHKHKSTGIIYDRTSDPQGICLDCVKEAVEDAHPGMEFLKGHLIHLALTRVPINGRTLIETEVERSMAIKTRKEDAMSIVENDEEALEQLDEIDQEASLVGKAELVIKSDADFVEEAEHMDDEDEEECPEGDEECEEMKKEKARLVQEAKTKSESWGDESMGSYLVVEDASKPTTWHLPVKKNGKIDHGLMGAAKAALTAAGGHRGNKYGGPGKAKALAKLKRLYKSEGLDWEEKSEVDKDMAMVEPSYVVYKPFGGATSLEDAKAYIEAQKEQMRISDIWYAFQSVVGNIASDEEMENKVKAKALVAAATEFKDMISDKEASIYKSLFALANLTQEESVDTPIHPLDEIFAKMKSSYDTVVGSVNNPDEALRQIQTPFNEFGTGLVEIIRANIHTPPPDPNQTILSQMEAMNQKIAELAASIQQRGAPATDNVTRRSFAPPAPRPVQPALQSKPGGVKSIAEIVEATT